MKNLALGVTAETQEMADLRIPILSQIPAALRFVSIEPMLGAVDLGVFTGKYTESSKTNKITFASYVDSLDWVIAGGETGPGARTFPDMAEVIVNLKDQCQEAGVPFYFKGWGGKKSWKIDGTKYEHLPIINGVEYRQRPAGW